MQLPDSRLSLKDYLDSIVDKVNNIGFIENDPITVPHRFSNKQDIEIAAFFSAMLSWGNRKTIIMKSIEIMDLMDNSPYDFICNHQEKEKKAFLHFKHRTFQTEDLLYFIDFLQEHYVAHSSLETAFHPESNTFYNQRTALIHFHHYFFKNAAERFRTKKHIATPAKNSTCKKLNMLLRWMVRCDEKKVDFGLWNTIPASALMIPLDVHVETFARKFGLLTRKQIDWTAVEEITAHLRSFDPADPIKYDYALFGLGISAKQSLHT